MTTKDQQMEESLVKGISEINFTVDTAGDGNLFEHFKNQYLLIQTLARVVTTDG